MRINGPERIRNSSTEKPVPHGLLAEKKRNRYCAVCLLNLASGRKTLTGEGSGEEMAPCCRRFAWGFPGFNLANSPHYYRHSS